MVQVRKTNEISNLYTEEPEMLKISGSLRFSFLDSMTKFIRAGLDVVPPGGWTKANPFLVKVDIF